VVDELERTKQRKLTTHTMCGYRLNTEPTNSVNTLQAENRPTFPGLF